MIIIAEIGINHNGNLHLAHEMIRQAKFAGADIAKFQFYDPDRIFGPKGSYPNKENYKFALTVQFDYEQVKKLKYWCDQEGIEFMATVTDEERFKWTEDLKVKRYKISSRMVIDKAFCSKILKTGKETFVSLGFWKGQRVPFKEKNVRYLYCVAKYPCQYEDLKMPVSFNSSFYSGFSDHTIGVEAALVAVARGAMVIEKHFTLNKGLAGPDHICSADPSELEALCRYSRLMENYLNSEKAEDSHETH